MTHEHAIARLPVVIDLMRKEPASVPEGFLDPEQAGRLADTASRIFSDGAASIRDAIDAEKSAMPSGRREPA